MNTNGRIKYKFISAKLIVFSTGNLSKRAGAPPGDYWEWLTAPGTRLPGSRHFPAPESLSLKIYTAGSAVNT